MSGGSGGSDKESKLLQQQIKQSEQENQQKKLKQSAQVIASLRTGLSNTLFGSGGSVPIQSTPAPGRKKSIFPNFPIGNNPTGQ